VGPQLRALQWVLAIVLLLALLLIAFINHGSARVQSEPELYEGIPLDAALLRLDKQALNEAYHGQVVKLWTIWVTDGAKEADRISRGLKIARGAYHSASQQIVKREQQMQDQK
jgi:hypothetical protein